MEPNTIIIYHANCRDGFCAAYVLHHEERFRDAKFVPAQYGDDPPDVTGKNVIVVDFSWERDVMIGMRDVAHSILVLDHHKTAEAELKDLPWAIFDLNRSGAQLAWDELIASFHNYHTARPWLVDYTADRDLWRFDLDESLEVNACIRSYPLTFEAWDQLAKFHPVEAAIGGTHILRYRSELVREHVARAEDIQILGLKGRGCYCSTSDIISEVAQELSRGVDFGCIWFDTGNERVYSLRSVEGTDVSEIATHFGGGGHKGAAGFRVHNYTVNTVTEIIHRFLSGR